MGIFTGDGRVGRLHYFAINLAIGCGWLVCVLAMMRTDPATGATTFNPALIVIFPIVMWLSVANMVRRLHDRGHNGLLWLLSLLPLVNFGLALYLLFAPGDEVANRYGPRPGGVDPKQADAQRQALDTLQARVEDVQRQADQSYYREDGTYDMDWMTASVPGLGSEPPSGSSPTTG